MVSLKDARQPSWAVDREHHTNTVPLTFRDLEGAQATEQTVENVEKAMGER